MLLHDAKISVWVHTFQSKLEHYEHQLKAWFSAQDIACINQEKKRIKSTVLILDLQKLLESEQELIQQLLMQEHKIIIVDTCVDRSPFYKVWSLLELGVIDILSWKLQDKIATLIEARFNRILKIEQILASDLVKEHLVGSSEVWKNTLQEVIEYAYFGQAPVLIMGESGTGKELVANLIHQLDQRFEKQKLILLDCSSVVPELFGSEFFGHEKGAFTNAIAAREGAFELASNGSLFLDEIGELPHSLQAALLRVVQEGLYKRLGSNMWRKSKFRLISATHRNLPDLIEKGDFRLDLFYRISTCIIRLPALKERKLDIPELTKHFLVEALQIPNPPEIEKEVIQYLITRDYRGNIRELRQLIFRMASRYTGSGILTLGCIPFHDRQSGANLQHAWHENGFVESIRQALADRVDLKTIKRTAGDIALQLAIEEADGKLPLAAQQLGVSDRMVQKWKNEQI